MKEQEDNKRQPFWNTLPGILTGCAALIGAIAGLVTILYTIGVFQRPTPSPDVPIILTTQAPFTITDVPPPTTQAPPTESPPPITDVPPPTESPLPITGLTAHYPFNGGANDLSGKENHGTINGAALTSDRYGLLSSAFSFDGENDSIVIPDSSSLHITQQISIAAWVFPTAQKTQEIVRKGAGVNGPTAAPYSLALSGTGDIVFSLRPNLQFIQVRKTGYPLAVWLFLVGTYDGTTMKLYVNGNLESQTLVSGSLNENSSQLLIGTRLNLPADTFQGIIDDVRIYNRALTSEEIELLYSE